MDITKIDKNFANTFSFEGMKTYDVNQPPFSLHGLCRQEGELDYKRLPHEFAKDFGNPSVEVMYRRTAGIRVRFKTDSSRIILKCTQPEQVNIPHISITGSSCFDLYADGQYCNVFRPGIDVNGKYSENKDMTGGYQSGFVFKGERKMREILIHFPSYNGVDDVFLALEEDAQVLPPREYTYKDPVLFYGSSITQGACASHPGNGHVAILSRLFDFDFINLGFSGGCLGEKKFATYIGGLKLGALVMDYDHNASLQGLIDTHEAFFLEFRRLQPDTPVIFITTSDLAFTYEGRIKRKEVIRKTYENALAAGDKNVYFVDGSVAYDEVGIDYCVVDNGHPNDLGFWCIAQNAAKVFAKVF